MEEKFLKLKSMQNLIFLLLFSLLFSCVKEKPKSVFDQSIHLTKNNESIKDSLKALKKRGINFVVCYTETNDINDILSFNIVHEPGKNNHTLNVDSDFKIETIENVDVLYLNFEKTLIQPSKKIEKKTKELLDKKIITFNGKNRFIDCDFIQFVFCKKDENIFKSFNNRMEIDEQNRLHEIGKPYYRESFYPKCE